MGGDNLTQFFHGYLEKQPLFLNKKVLQSNYTPENITHRNEQIDYIAGILAPSLGLEKPSNLFLYGKTGCIAGDSLVYTNNGWKKIKDVDVLKDKVISFNIKDKKYEWSNFLFLKFENKSKLLKIILDNGCELIVTKDHPLLSSNMKWKKADELKIFDEIVLGYDLPNINTKLIPLSLARLIGFTISDGSLNRRKRRVKHSKGSYYNSDRQRYRYFSVDNNLLQLVQKDLKELFYYTPSIEYPKNRCSHVQVISKEICLLLNNIGIPFGKKSYIVEIPSLILESSNVIQKEFLKALFSGDGTVSKNTYEMEYYSNSKKLLQQISYLLLQEGILSKIRIKYAKLNNKKFESYRLYICGRENLIKFYYKIGFYNKEKEIKLLNLLNKYKNLNFEFSKESYKTLKIKSIEKVYEPFVYDLTVPKNHNFIANGFISHNTGKTVVTKYVSSQILKVAREKALPLEVVYINCKLKRIADTEYRLISQLAKEFGLDIPPTGLPTDEVYKIFLKYIDQEKKLIILILDEIDQLIKKAGDGLLYNLTRMNSELKNVELTVIGISNDLLFMDNIDPRVKSSLSEEELVFSPYNALQIQDILRNRSQIAFREGVIQNGVIEKCAAYAAREHGDARRALELLRVAAELSERRGDSKILIKDIDDAEEKIEKDKVLDIVHTQPKQFQLTLLAILDLCDKAVSPLFTGDVYEIYKDFCSVVKLKPLTQRRVSDIIAELDMLGIINAKVISKGRYGRTKEIRMAIPQSTVPTIRHTLKEGLNL